MIAAVSAGRLPATTETGSGQGRRTRPSERDDGDRHQARNPARWPAGSDPDERMPMFDIHRVEIDWGGRKLSLETGHMARQADAAVLAQYGETTVLATVVAAKSVRPGMDFFPLTVNYQEKTYAAGRFPGAFLSAKAVRPRRKPSPLASSTARSARFSSKASSTRPRSSRPSSPSTTRTIQTSSR